MSNIQLGEQIRKVEGVDRWVDEVRERIQKRINLDKYTNNIQQVTINTSILMRSCLLVGLSSKEPRAAQEITGLKIAPTSPRLLGVLNNNQTNAMIVALLRMRYHDVDIDLSVVGNVSRVIGYEIMRGCRMLLEEGVIDDWLNFTPAQGAGRLGQLPELNLHIGQYENGIDATIDINNRSVPNTQMVIAGSTGSGKTNLLVRLINQLRELSTGTSYPVNFLLFDYKGEFSDEAHRDWLDMMELPASAILEPIKQPLPFNPFVDMSGKTMGEINLEASNLAAALIAIFGAKVSASMDNYLRSAINEAYKETKGAPVSFALILKHYQKVSGGDRVDTIVNSLKSMIDAHMFADTDDIDLINNSFIINLGKYQNAKNNSLSKAVIYFTLAKLNSIYESLSVQATDDDRVQIRHFTIIDEAHHMLDFDNQPLKNLVQMGRNKGMSIILATQDMTNFKTDYFDFYQNAYFPIIMRQQQVNNSIVGGLFGGNSKETTEIQQVISNLQLGEAIVKNNEHDLLGGKRYKKIKVTKMI